MAQPDGLDAETIDPPLDGETTTRRALVLTIALHPELRRVGQRAVLRGKGLQISRLAPLFAPPAQGSPGPLADPSISRAPILVHPEGDAVRLELSGELVIDGRAQSGTVQLSAAELELGVVLELGRRTVLVLGVEPEAGGRLPQLGLIGASAGLERVRRDILRAAPLELSVLIRGETGSGKELVAQALHASSPRARGPCVAVSLATLGASVAAAELFGHVKGAFTGAVEDRQGYFARADGGTLFLDEIGEAPPEVQVMLLRALETGTVQRVGGRQEERVDVRLVAATDADLQRMVADGRFRAPLLHRLAGFEIHVPALRQRRSDIGLLAVSFLREQCSSQGSEPPVLAAATLSRLLRAPWPGNVRQLRNVARQMAIASLDGASAVDAAVDRLLEEEAESAPEPSAAGEPARKPAEVSPDEVYAAMEHNQWRIERAAADLGISRPSMYRLIAAHPQLRTAKELSAEELRHSFAACAGDLTRMSDELRISRAGLRARLKEEGIAE